jgi:hypothetical protein
MLFSLPNSWNGCLKRWISFLDSFPSLTLLALCLAIYNFSFLCFISHLGWTLFGSKNLMTSNFQSLKLVPIRDGAVFLFEERLITGSSVMWILIFWIKPLNTNTSRKISKIFLFPLEALSWIINWWQIKKIVSNSFEAMITLFKEEENEPQKLFRGCWF